MRSFPRGYAVKSKSNQYLLHHSEYWKSSSKCTQPTQSEIKPPRRPNVPSTTWQGHRLPLSPCRMWKTLLWLWFLLIRSTPTCLSTEKETISAIRYYSKIKKYFVIPNWKKALRQETLPKIASNGLIHMINFVKWSWDWSLDLSANSNLVAQYRDPLYILSETLIM